MDCETQWLLSHNTAGSEYTNWQVCLYFSRSPWIIGNAGYYKTIDYGGKAINAIHIWDWRGPQSACGEEYQTSNII